MKCTYLTSIASRLSLLSLHVHVTPVNNKVLHSIKLCIYALIIIANINSKCSREHLYTPMKNKINPTMGFKSTDENFWQSTRWVEATGYATDFNTPPNRSHPIKLYHLKSQQFWLRNLVLLCTADDYETTIESNQDPGSAWARTNENSQSKSVPIPENGWFLFKTDHTVDSGMERC